MNHALRRVTLLVAVLGAAVWALAPDLVSTSILGENPKPMKSTLALSNPLIGAYTTADQRDGAVASCSIRATSLCRDSAAAKAGERPRCSSTFATKASASGHVSLVVFHSSQSPVEVSIGSA